MIAVDTNILVRYLTNDDPIQAQLALKILSKPEKIFIAKTVLLEVEWVLRSVYEFKPSEIDKAILQILGLPNVVPEFPEQIALALKYYRQGMDFADALHLVANFEIKHFYTFDKAFVKKTKNILPNVTLVKKSTTMD
ncbi:type II toxin-antitoxin system VapC family toxin [Candidatus Halobeggiatoa sp. HSG11]|nr:type II toxin-antitoxin system VapC family toxin [Candidatus Halobeggiatoa sp. HSG11]